MTSAVIRLIYQHNTFFQQPEQIRRSFLNDTHTIFWTLFFIPVKKFFFALKKCLTPLMLFSAPLLPWDMLFIGGKHYPLFLDSEVFHCVKVAFAPHKPGKFRIDRQTHFFIQTGVFSLLNSVLISHFSLLAYCFIKKYILSIDIFCFYTPKVYIF